MTDRERQLLYSDMVDLEAKVSEIKDKVRRYIEDEEDAEATPTPLGEQVWTDTQEDHHSIWGTTREAWWVRDEKDTLIAVVFDKHARGIILGIPALVKACREHIDEYPQGDLDNNLLNALKAMGVEEDG